MNFNQLRTQAIKEYYPAFFLENLWPRGNGKFLLALLKLAWGVLFLIGLVLFGFGKSTSTEFMMYVPKAFGAAALAFGIWMAAGAVHAFYNWYYFKSMPEGGDAPPLLSFELGRIVYQSSAHDILSGFLESDEGFEIMMRAGISTEEVRNFLSNRKVFIDSEKFQIPETQYVTASDYAVALMHADQAFAQFLFAHGIQEKDFKAITEWVFERELSRRAKTRWWSRSRLSRIPGIGKNWSYGQINNLEKFIRPTPELEGEEYETHDVYGTQELKQLESILTRSRSANALLVSDDRAGNIHIVARLNRNIDNGTAAPQLEHKRIIMLDAELLVSSVKDKSDFENIVLLVLKEAQNAGNVILVITDFPSFMKAGESFGTDVSSVLDPFLSSGSLQVVGLTDTASFHNSIERSSALMSRFEHILIEEVDELNTIRVLENEIVALESHSRIMFTYPALVAIADSAERYFPDGVMPNKAIDLLYEITPKLAGEGKSIVRKEDVLQLIKSKTGIPMGMIENQEREKLLNLETILHQRIIGQDEAVNAIANAVRRARSGINNPNRPLASFLFLGPTGVGKTETTKALGDIFFGKDAQILRLDMSEYSTPDALSKLIGSFAAGKTGVLATILREHPYGVLLLDEFEKTTPEVMNLFLQVLDEGFFADMDGKRINARNLVIIATSNAGSDMIWEAVKHGDNLDHARDLIIDSLIKSHIFKPELLNRFDGVITFHPLDTTHLERIARLQLEKLKARLAERGINLAVNDDLVKYLMRFGTDPKFGARPMNRAIQDKIEQVIAEKMIRGDIVLGAEIVLSEQDLR
jgi:ATP-dependent Clp protease ATP-binding subunit ClpC